MTPSRKAQLSSSSSSSSTTTTTTSPLSSSSSSPSLLRLSEFALFFIFATVHVIGATINHIDDTDEVYGYYEPLHYLLYGKGMQTWEYSPTYAIRYFSNLYFIMQRDY